jgi:hypothetical protein
MLRGTQKTVLTPGKNKKVYLAGALNARAGRLTWVEADRKDSILFERQLWQLVKRDYPQAGVVKGREKLVWPWFGLSVPLMDVFAAQTAIRC